MTIPVWWTASSLSAWWSTCTTIPARWSTPSLSARGFLCDSTAFLLHLLLHCRCFMLAITLLWFWSMCSSRREYSSVCAGCRQVEVHHLCHITAVHCMVMKCGCLVASSLSLTHCLMTAAMSYMYATCLKRTGTSQRSRAVNHRQDLGKSLTVTPTLALVLYE